MLMSILLGNSTAQAQVSEQQIYKLTQVLNNISRFYTDSVNENEIIENAIVSTLKELDPHSLYHSKEEVDEITEEQKSGLITTGKIDGKNVIYINELNNPVYSTSIILKIVRFSKLTKTIVYIF